MNLATVLSLQQCLSQWWVYGDGFRTSPLFVAEWAAGEGRMTMAHGKYGRGRYGAVESKDRAYGVCLVARLARL
jgi:hypothetical protein